LDSSIPGLEGIFVKFLGDDELSVQQKWQILSQFSIDPEKDTLCSSAALAKLTTVMTILSSKGIA